MKTGAKKWIAFNFDVSSNSIPSPRESQKLHVERAKSSNLKITNDVQQANETPGRFGRKADFNLLEKLKPKLIEDLAVHSAKIKEVQLWLQEKVVAASNTLHSPILLMTGPTGSGKTATVNVLTKSMGVKLVEWVNPVEQDFELGFGETQIGKFKDFFTQSKYTSLCDDTTSTKVALVEDFPNFVSYNTTEFQDILEKCYNSSTPVIFICTDVCSKKLDLSQILFPQEVKEKFHITTISFNPCATTQLKSAIKRARNVVQAHPDIFRNLSSDIVDAIISSAMGDIRCAINQFHFACLKGTTEIPTFADASKSRGGKRKRNEKPSSSIKSMLRDETLGFFHGLGRVLNPKRTKLQNTWRIQCDFDGLIDQFATQPSIFSSFLQENYLNYFGDFNEAQQAAEVLSQAQVFLEKWIDRQDILVYALWVSVLGLMIFNEHKVSKWNQIKPLTKVKKITNNSLDSYYIKKSDYLYHNIITKSNKFHTFNSKK